MFVVSPSLLHSFSFLRSRVACSGLSLFSETARVFSKFLSLHLPQFLKRVLKILERYNTVLKNIVLAVTKTSFHRTSVAQVHRSRPIFLFYFILCAKVRRGFVSSFHVKQTRVEHFRISTVIVEAGEMALVSVNNPTNNELVSATGGQVAVQQVWFIYMYFQIHKLRNLD